MQSALRDLDIYRRKYRQLKRLKHSTIDHSMKDLKVQMERLEKENKELGNRIKGGSTSHERSLINKVEELSRQLDCANERCKRIEKDFEDYKADNSLQHELDERAVKMRDE